MVLCVATAADLTFHSQPLIHTLNSPVRTWTPSQILTQKWPYPPQFFLLWKQGPHTPWLAMNVPASVLSTKIAANATSFSLAAPNSSPPISLGTALFLLEL